MRILIVANFCLDFNGNVDGRFLYLAELLSQRGHDVELITSDFSHSTKKRKVRPLQEAYKTKLTYCHEPGYVKHTGIKRLWSHYVWGKNVMKYVKTIEKPDLIYCAIPSLTSARLLAGYCKRNHIRFAVDIQDLWPEATFMLLKNRILRSFTLPMKWYANKSYAAADYIIAVSRTYVNRALSVNKKHPKHLSVFLGNDKAYFEKGLKFLQKKPIDEFWINYVGTLSYSYDLKCVIDAIELLNKRETIDKKLRFVVCGDGPLRKQFEDYAKARRIDFCFYGKLPYAEMVGVMCSSDVVVNCITRGAAQSITNKIGDYALSGLPVINTQESDEYRAMVEKYQCGINCECGNSEQVADAIKKLVNDRNLRKSMGYNSSVLGRELFDRRHTYLQIVNMITQ